MTDRRTIKWMLVADAAMPLWNHDASSGATILCNRILQFEPPASELLRKLGLGAL